jgi:hypothetical protein
MWFSSIQLLVCNPSISWATVYARMKNHSDCGANTHLSTHYSEISDLVGLPIWTRGVFCDIQCYTWFACWKVYWGIAASKILIHDIVHPRSQTPTLHIVAGFMILQQILHSKQSEENPMEQKSRSGMKRENDNHGPPCCMTCNRSGRNWRSNPNHPAWRRHEGKAGITYLVSHNGIDWEWHLCCFGQLVPPHLEKGAWSMLPERFGTPVCHRKQELLTSHRLSVQVGGMK